MTPKALKRAARARMARTGERYMTALRGIREQRPEPAKKKGALPTRVVLHIERPAEIQRPAAQVVTTPPASRALGVALAAALSTNPSKP